MTIVSSSIENLLLKLDESKIEQVTKWVDKYYPENPFGAKVAKFAMYDKIRVLVEKDENDTEYRFEIEEPILLIAIGICDSNRHYLLLAIGKLSSS